MYTISYIGTDYWSRIPVGASSSHRVCSPSAPSRRPTPPSNFSLSAMYRFLFCTYLYPQWVVLTSYFAFYYIFCGTSPFISLYICNIVYISTVLSTDLFLFSNSYLRKYNSQTTNWGKFSLTCASIAYQLHTAPLARLKNNHIDKVIQPLVIYLKHI